MALKALTAFILEAYENSKTAAVALKKIRARFPSLSPKQIRAIASEGRAAGAALTPELKTDLRTEMKATREPSKKAAREAGVSSDPAKEARIKRMKARFEKGLRTNKDIPVQDGEYERLQAKKAKPKKPAAKPKAKGSPERVPPKPKAKAPSKPKTVKVKVRRVPRSQTTLLAPPRRGAAPSPAASVNRRTLLVPKEARKALPGSTGRKALPAPVKASAMGAARAPRPYSGPQPEPRGPTKALPAPPRMTVKNEGFVGPPAPTGWQKLKGKGKGLLEKWGKQGGWKRAGISLMAWHVLSKLLEAGEGRAEGQWEDMGRGMEKSGQPNNMDMMSQVILQELQTENAGAQSQFATDPNVMQARMQDQRMEQRELQMQKLRQSLTPNEISLGGAGMQPVQGGDGERRSGGPLGALGAFLGR